MPRTHAPAAAYDDGIINTDPQANGSDDWGYEHQAYPFGQTTT